MTDFFRNLLTRWRLINVKQRRVIVGSTAVLTICLAVVWLGNNWGYVTVDLGEIDRTPQTQTMILNRFYDALEQNPSAMVVRIDYRIEGKPYLYYLEYARNVHIVAWGEGAFTKTTMDEKHLKLKIKHFASNKNSKSPLTDFVMSANL